MTEPQMVLVPADLLTATTRYLMARPYVEVQMLVPALLACRPVEAAPTPEAGKRRAQR